MLEVNPEWSRTLRNTELMQLQFQLPRELYNQNGFCKRVLLVGNVFQRGLFPLVMNVFLSNVLIKIEVSGKLFCISREIFCCDQFLWRLWSQHKNPNNFIDRKMNTKQKFIMGTDQETSRWKMQRLLIIHRTWREDCFRVEHSMSPPKIIQPLAFPIACDDCWNHHVII